MTLLENLLIYTVLLLSNVIIYLITFLMLFNNSLSQYGNVWELTMYYALFCLLIFLSNLIWLFRIILFPLEAPVSQWFWFWKLYIFLMAFGPIFLAFFGIKLFNFSKEKIINAILLIPILIFFVVIFLSLNDSQITVSNQSLVSTKNTNIFLLLVIFVVIFYMLIPIYQLLIHNKLNPNRNTLSYKKGRLIVISLFIIISSISGQILNITIPLNDMINNFLNIFLFIGGFITFYAFKKYSITKDSNDEFD